MGPEIDVLVVDDNASIRELMVQSLAPLARVEAVGSGLEALARAQKRVPDLVVCDYRMPGLSGMELLGKLSGMAPRAAVVMLASRADIAGPLASCSAKVEEFIEKPFFIEDATSRIKRVLDRVVLSKVTQDAADSTSVRGTLAQMSVVDLLQTLDIGRKSCSLVLTRDGERSEMLFHDGQLVHATLGTLSGEAAVYKVVAWNEGAFQIDFERRECPRTVTHSTQSVLLEALRLFDEAQRDGETAECSPESGSGAGFAPVSAAVPAAAVGF
jgi:CheY-like chemotaxis protein